MRSCSTSRPRTDRAPFGALLLACLLLPATAGCRQHPSLFEGDIFAGPVDLRVDSEYLPLLGEAPPKYEYPDFKGQDGSVTRCLWMEPGIAEKLLGSFKDNPDWMNVTVEVVKDVFQDSNVKAGGKAAACNDALMISGSREAVDVATELVGHLLSSIPQISIEVRVVEVQQTDELGYGFNWFVQDRDRPYTPIDPLNPPADPTRTYLNRAALGAGIPGIPGSGAVGAGFIPDALIQLGTLSSNVRVDLIISALQLFNKVDVVNAPNVQVLSGFQASINAGQEVPYFNLQVAGNQTLVATVFKKVAVDLEVVPRMIAQDIIRMTVNTKVENVTGLTTVVSAGSEVTNPIIATRGVTTTLDVRDGETVVLGGLITNSRIESEEQVPVLGDVPILGLLFRSQAKRDVQSNLVFFIRPRILTSLERGGTRLIVPPPDSGGGRIVTPPPRGEGGG